MKQLIVNGRLGADAEIKMTKNGNAYLQFRIANSNRKDEPATWYRVTSFIPFHINVLKQWLTKGKAVIVMGDYSDGIYVGQTGQPQIDRTIQANMIEFDNGGQQNTEGSENGGVVNRANNTQTAPLRNPSMGSMTMTAAPTSSTPSPTIEVKAETVPTSTAAPHVTDSVDDDLPF